MHKKLTKYPVKNVQIIIELEKYDLKKKMFLFDLSKPNFLHKSVIFLNFLKKNYNNEILKQKASILSTTSKIPKRCIYLSVFIKRVNAFLITIN